MQQTAVVLATVLFAGCAYLIITKKKFLYVLLQFIITVAGSLYSYSINVFGDNSRMLRETNRYFPGFAELNIFEKAELGFSSTMYCLTMKPHFAWAAFLIFTLLLAIAAYKLRLTWFKRIVVSFPFAFSLIIGILSLVPQKHVPFLKHITGSLKHYKMTKATYSFEIIPDIIFILICLCILYSLFVLIDERKAVFVCIATLLLGFGSRMLMGFSPTVWASGYRTFFIMFTSFIIVSVLVTDSCIERLRLRGDNE